MFNNYSVCFKYEKNIYRCKHNMNYIQSINFIDNLKITDYTKVKFNWFIPDFIKPMIIKNKLNIILDYVD